MTPPTPEPSSWAVSNQKEYYGYYTGGGVILKLDGELIDTYGTLTDGTDSWTLVNYDAGMVEYYTPGFFDDDNVVYLECHVNSDVYRFNGSTWQNLSGSTDSTIAASIVSHYSDMGIDSDLLTVFVNGSVSL